MLDENNHLALAKGSGDIYAPLSPDFNTLYFDGFGFPHWLPKVSETEWPLPPSNFGMWIIDYITLGDSELWLLPDRRYINKSGSGFQSEGTYSLDNNTAANGLITYDPICDGPYSREVEFVDNQMVQRSDGTVFTYRYVPEKLGDIAAAMAHRDQSEGQFNAAFAATHSLAQRDPDYFMVPGGYIVADLNSDNVYDDATVFQEAQVYQITFPTNPPEQIAFFLFPNGRYQFLSRTYIDLGGGVGEYQNMTGWGKYQIEEEVIYSLSDLGEAIELPLVLGRRRAVWNEACLDKKPV